MTKEGKHDLTEEKRNLKTGSFVERLGRGFENPGTFGVELTGMSLRAPNGERGEYLAVVRALDDAGAPIVAFHSAMFLADLLVGLTERLNNGSMRWRDDEFRQ